MIKGLLGDLVRKMIRGLLAPIGLRKLLSGSPCSRLELGLQELTVLRKMTTESRV